MLLRFVKDSLAEAVDRQKEQADKRGRKNKEVFRVNDRVLLATANLPTHALSNMQTRKLTDRFIGPFRVIRKNGDAYTIDLPKAMRLHPTFYVGRLKRYHPSLQEPAMEHPAPDQQLVDPSEQCEQGSSPVVEDAPEQSYPVQSPSGVARANVARTPYVAPPSLEAARPAYHGSLRDQTTDAPLLSLPKAAARASRDFQLPPESEYTASPSVRQQHSSTTGSSSPRFSSSRPGARPLIDSHGVERWIVDTIVDHKDLNASILRRLTDKNGHIVPARIQNVRSLRRNWEIPAFFVFDGSATAPITILGFQRAFF